MAEVDHFVISREVTMDSLDFQKWSTSAINFPAKSTALHAERPDFGATHTPRPARPESRKPSGIGPEKYGGRHTFRAQSISVSATSAGRAGEYGSARMRPTREAIRRFAGELMAEVDHFVI